MKPERHRRRSLFGLGILAAAMWSGCVMAPVVPPLGAVYSGVQAPLDLDSGQGKQIGPAQGEASTRCIFFLVAWGDGGIDAAARNGGLQTVNHVDYEFRNILFGIYSRYTTIAYGVKE